MITTEIYNGQGLGNQLWCYIVTRVIAKNKGYEFGIKSPEKFKCNNFLDLDFGKEVIGGTGPEGGPPTELPEGIKYYYRERRITHPENGVDISVYDKNLVNILDNTKIDGTMQDEQYILHRKDEIREWLKVRKEHECYDFSDENICIINFRGGEYTRIKNVFLPQKYWDDAVENMKKINKNFKFVVITDNIETAKKFFPNFDVFHFSISKDYVVVKNAKYLILSNSSFAWFPTWLNKNLKYCIAPKYWSQYNTSDGFWGCGFNITQNWLYQDRDGNLNDYNSCIKEFNEYKEKNKDYFAPTKIKNNFLVVSNYNNDISWVPRYTDDYLIYDQSEKIDYPETINPKKIIKNKHLGHNIYDYCTYIIDNYNQLPERVIFATGNVFPRHISQEYFEKVMNNNFFTPIFEVERHKEKWPTAFFSSNGLYCEINNSWYLNESHPTKYFHNYNNFLKFCFENPIIPKHITFAPGANYIVPKENILKLPKIFYQNLKTFVSHCPHAIPGESHIIERALYTIWTSNFDLNKKMLSPIDENFIVISPQKNQKNNFRLLKKITPLPIKTIIKFIIQLLKKYIPMSIKGLIIQSIRKISFKNLKLLFKITTEKTKCFFGREPKYKEITKYRKNIKIYDIFTFFNELDLLEIRLNMLDKYVGYFVIIEATETFSGKPKKLFYEENKHLFKKFNHKIIHHITTDTPINKKDLENRLLKKNLNNLDKEIINNSLTSDNVPKNQVHWLKEFYQKESIKKALIDLSDDDICFVSDVDEIWNPKTIIDFRKDDIFKLKQKVYSYFLNNRSNEQWAGTLVTKYKNIRTGCLNHLRTKNKTNYTYIKDGGWHFTNLGGTKKIKTKLESYGHQEFNNEEIKSQIEERIKNNEDFIGRKFKFWVDERDLPEYLLKNKDKYKELFSAR